ncbi:MAG: exodeoxyribonuclease VII small subunit [Planctomycetaceae bacterium]
MNDARGRDAGAPPAGADGGTFEERLARLGDLVGRLEAGQLGLAESIGAYEQGVALVRSLQAELVDVEQRVRVLTTAAAEPSGGPGVRDDAAAEAAAPAARRPGGRGARGAGGAAPAGEQRPSGSRVRKLPGMDDAGAEA